MACLTVGLVVLVLMVTAEAYMGNSSESGSFCKETDECLLYDLVCRTEEYEVRHYSPTKWVSTDEESYFMEVATTLAFRKLFKYINGANDEEVMIDMTAPVVVKMKEKRKFWQSSVYTLSFPLPSAYQESPPTPTNSELYFTDMPDMNVYVRSYGGWMFCWTVKRQSECLKKDLDRAHASYEEDFLYAAGYDSPMKFWNRHNEIWVQVEGDPVCPPTRN